MTFESRSQAGQDRFVYEVLRGKRDGTFLDVGANNPSVNNNSYTLEKDYGWRGLLVDNSPDSMFACEKERKSAFYMTDASKPQDWIAALKQAEVINRGKPVPPEEADDSMTNMVDFLSLDVDESTLAALQNLPLDTVRFTVLTIETDRYRFGDGPRDAMLEILRKHDYDVLCSDVMDQGLPFEIWACDSWGEIPSELKDRFRRDKPTEWREFFK